MQLKRLATAGAILGALVLVAGLSVYFAGAAKDEAPLADLTPLGELGVDLALLVEGVDGRTEYGFCVDGAGGYDIAEADVNKVRAAVDSAFAALPSIPHRVVVGCPAPMALTGEDLDAVARVQRLCLADGERPSPHAVALYFVTEETFDRAFPRTYPYALTAEERICDEGDVWRAVTGGVYVTSSITAAQLRYAFLDAEGLAPGLPEGCVGEPLRPSWIVTPESDWCDALWREVGVTPPPRR